MIGKFYDGQNAAMSLIPSFYDDLDLDARSRWIYPNDTNDSRLFFSFSP